MIATPRTKKAKKTNTTNAEEPMKWTPRLTALAIETRYKNPTIVSKFAAKNLDAKKLSAIWNDALVTFMERAITECAWGEATPRVVTITQFKNKLKTVLSAFKLRCRQLQATGNRSHDDSHGDAYDEEQSNTDDESPFNSIPPNYLVTNARITSSELCDPSLVRMEYREMLGNELAVLWPLLCDCFAGRHGCTGEPLCESGASNNTSADTQNNTVSSQVSDDSEDEDESNVPSDATTAREQAKANAKRAKKHKKSTSSMRPADVMHDVFTNGFASLERIFTARAQQPEPPQSNNMIAAALHNMAAALETSRNQQDAMMETMWNLQQQSQTTATLLMQCLESFKKHTEK
jgi:hypothetical protein